ncbi:hypothetical protein FF38_08959 [Lucilia cuprina]|uniref:THAP-type domain-containing protein n=1 Tax=Lucilia cuprina TaxID=7375 RepID=A0A0L0C4Y5_LUCCU|nr:hypothetical protein CVS40_2351 [Lucilia cuprina]KNC27311.1 hypothetical protein FF38_08959 [Lucilia cuprina]
MRTCFVPFCDSKNKDQPNRTMFLVPKEPVLFAQWAELLPKVRTLRSIDRVCYLHFRPEDVVYTFDHCINGQIFKIHRDRPRLKPDALPCLEMTTKEELLSYKVKHRLRSNAKVSENTIADQISDLITEKQSPDNETKMNTEEIDEILLPLEDNKCGIIVNFEDDNENITNQETRTNNESENQIIDDLITEETSYECEETLNTNKQHLVLNKILDLFNLLYDNVYEVIAPNTLWGIHRCPHRSMICFTYMDVTKLQVSKMISITPDGLVQLIIHGSTIKTLELVQDIDDFDSMSVLLNQVDMWRLCFGKLTDSNAECEIIVEPNDDNSWSTDDNAQIFLCKQCLQASKDDIDMNL